MRLLRCSYIGSQRLRLWQVLHPRRYAARALQQNAAVARGYAPGKYHILTTTWLEFCSKLQQLLTATLLTCYTLTITLTQTLIKNPTLTLTWAPTLS